MEFDWSASWPPIPLLLEGAKLTLWLSVLGTVGSLITVLVAGLTRTSGGWCAKYCAQAIMEVFRGTPNAVQVMFNSIALALAFPDLHMDRFSAAVVTIMIISGACFGEIR